MTKHYTAHTGATVTETDDGSNVTYTISGEPEQVHAYADYLLEQFAGYMLRVISNIDGVLTMTRWNNSD